VGVRDVKWEERGTERAEDYMFFYGEGNGDHKLGTGFFVDKSIISAVNRVESITDRTEYVILRCS
jgi:hypothetical protein